MPPAGSPTPIIELIFVNQRGTNLRITQQKRMRRTGMKKGKQVRGIRQLQARLAVENDYYCEEFQLLDSGACLNVQ
jgi:hypothetical protein